MHDTLLDLVEQLLPLPTAACHEHHVVAAVRRYCLHHGIDVSSDTFGNLVLLTGGARDSGLCLTAHLDHPALGFGVPESSRDVLFERLGGVPTALTRDASVLLYDTAASGDCPPAPVASGTVSAFLHEGAPGMAAPAFRVRTNEAVPAGDLFAVWDQTPCAIEADRIVGTACDDLVGVCVALAVLQVCRLQDIGLSVLLTRAEETGFGGMLAAIEAETLPAADVFINIECSSCRAGAPLGDGPVVRVGDRRWLFDAGVTEALNVCATELAASRDGFRVQRRLMDGGVCEATPLARSGRATGAVALPLDNYHNNGGDRLRPEAVHLQDAENLVALLTHLAQKPAGAQATRQTSVQALDDMLATRRQAQTQRLMQRRIAP